MHPVAHGVKRVRAREWDPVHSFDPGLLLRLNRVEPSMHEGREFRRSPLLAHFADRERSFRSIVNTHFGDRERSGATLDLV